MYEVFIVGEDNLISKMFEKRGWYVSDTMQGVDLIQFTGGTDVDPSFYEQLAHPTTYTDISRDQREEEVYEEAEGYRIPCAGICRGGQFLNVMNGGALYQDVDNHARFGTHEAVTRSGVELQVTSTHHQMMIPHEKGEVLLTAKESSYREGVNKKGDVVRYNPDVKQRDTEVVYYKESNTLCFQPHPEFVDNDHECRHYYFDLIDRFLILN